MPQTLLLQFPCSRTAGWLGLPCNVEGAGYRFSEAFFIQPHIRCTTASQPAAPRKGWQSKDFLVVKARGFHGPASAVPQTSTPRLSLHFPRVASRSVTLKTPSLTRKPTHRFFYFCNLFFFLGRQQQQRTAASLHDRQRVDTSEFCPTSYAPAPDDVLTSWGEHWVGGSRYRLIVLTSPLPLAVENHRCETGSSKA